jgi:flagellar hook assembly protein FlgD
MAIQSASAKLYTGIRCWVVDKNISAALTASFSLGNRNRPASEADTVFADVLVFKLRRAIADLVMTPSLTLTDSRLKTFGGGNNVITPGASRVINNTNNWKVNASVVCKFPTYFRIDVDKLQLPQGTTCTVSFEEDWIRDGVYLESTKSPSAAIGNFFTFRTPWLGASFVNSVFSMPANTVLRIKQLASSVNSSTNITAAGVRNPGKLASLVFSLFSLSTIIGKITRTTAAITSTASIVARTGFLKFFSSDVNANFASTLTSLNSRIRRTQSVMVNIIDVVCTPFQYEGIILNITNFATLAANVTRIEMTYNLFSTTAMSTANTRLKFGNAATQTVASTNIIGRRVALLQSNITAQSSLSCTGNKPMVIKSNGAGTFGLYGTVNATIQWTDGTETVVTTPGSYSYDAGAVGSGIITIRGTVQKYGPGPDNATYTHNSASVYSFGELPITHLDYAFRGVNFGQDSFVPTRLPTTITSLKGLFEGASQYTGRMVSTGVNFKAAENWIVDNVTDMSFMFKGCLNINTTSGGGTGTGITNWNVSNVTTMESMFENTSMSISIAGWNTVGLTNMKNIMNNV